MCSEQIYNYVYNDLVFIRNEEDNNIQLWQKKNINV